MLFFKKKSLPKEVLKFINKLKKHDQENMSKPLGKRELMPIPTDAQEAINILVDGLLGENWYIVDPLPNSQANTLIVDEILYRYNKNYRKEAKKYKKSKGK